MEKIPEELKNDIVVLESFDRKIFLLGTAHVSRKSCDEARLLVNVIKPGIVFLELCDKRSRLLSASPEDLKPIPFSERIKRLRNGEINLFSFTYSMLLEHTAAQLEIMPGEEFRAAYEEAVKIDATVFLGDRPVNITVKRLWVGLTIFEKISLVVQLLYSGISMPTPEELKHIMETLRKKTDLITEAVQDLGKSFPWIVECLIDERDLYMVLSLRECLRTCPGDIVAVVGAGHIPGITRIWTDLPQPTVQQEQEELARLMQYPSSRSSNANSSNPYTYEEFRTYVNERVRLKKESVKAIAAMTSSKQSLNAADKGGLLSKLFPQNMFSPWGSPISLLPSDLQVLRRKRRRTALFYYSGLAVVTFMGIGYYWSYLYLSRSSDSSSSSGGGRKVSSSSSEVASSANSLFERLRGRIIGR